ncbi:proprotein convertase subtilisin/kexin type 9 isoform X2 [Betta splendens]|uniref:Proprotein convertase subtilisin/kexin type 9 isoform X2 n=1 Tax=Betta splendens TaxID=158456 RepID=A0A6P7MCR2_BETSP|nr:proprotein convertase subtilisin/kexin type 9 isoform X2 [Betta splendens]
MRRTSALLGWALCLCASLVAGARDFTEDAEVTLGRVREDGTEPETGAEPGAEFLRCNKAAWRVPGKYLLILRQGTHESHVQRTMRRLQGKAARRGSVLEVLHTYSGAVRGLLVRTSSDVLNLARRLPHVSYVEEDSSIFAQSVPWNLQRLLQPHGGASENGTYQPPNDGALAEVFLMDGSVQSSHRELEGRVRLTDFSSVPEEDGVRLHRQAAQCDGHGTHTAGVVSGSDSGVARGAGVSLVRVLNCQGKGTVSGALAGMEFIRAALRARPAGAAVVLLPFAGALSRSLNAACRDLVAGGALVVAAAGNYRDDACLYSPGSEPEVLTVGAVNSADQLVSQGAGGTNYGRCVDVFAPGDDIISASSDCSTCFTSRSGTSQAAAHAAGVAAVILSSNQNASPLQVLHAMLRYSISNTIDLLSLPEPHRLATPNLVAAMPPAVHTQGALLCRSVWSARSDSADAHRAIARCRRGEEMMGCGSYSPDGARAGESLTVSGGRAECVAGAGGGGVYAVARCCAVAGLRCQVHPSPKPGLDAGCAHPQQQLTGCTSWSEATALTDSRPHHGGRRRCAVGEGVTSHALCCQAPALECLTSENGATGEQVEVSCPSGWTLTDCSAASQYSSTVGTVATGNSCHVRSSAGTDKTAGIAVCCRVRPPEEPDAAPR